MLVSCRGLERRALPLEILRHLVIEPTEEVGTIIPRRERPRAAGRCCGRAPREHLTVQFQAALVLPLANGWRALTEEVCLLNS